MVNQRFYAKISTRRLLALAIAITNTLQLFNFLSLALLSTSVASALLIHQCHPLPTAAKKIVTTKAIKDRVVVLAGTMEHMLPASSAPIISISDAFDGGNIEHVATTTNFADADDNSLQESPGIVEVSLKVKLDPFTQLEQRHHSQYFCFRSTVKPLSRELATVFKFNIVNANSCSYPSAWPGTTVFRSTDLKSWDRMLSTLYDADKGILHWTDDDTAKNGLKSGAIVYYAYFPPFSNDRHLGLIAQCGKRTSSHDGKQDDVKVYSLGQSLQGREMDCVQIGSGPLKCWVIHRQHPGENMAEYFAEGLLGRLLGLHSDGSLDGLARKARKLFTWYIVPNMNPDGAVLGHLRTNACGANLNREWSSSTYKLVTHGNEGNKDEEVSYKAPSLKRSPEVYHVLSHMVETGVDLFADIHGDEELPFNFIAGAEGCPNWGKRLQHLQGAFVASYCRANPDMQRKVSYEPERPGEGRMNVCSNQIAARFDCLAFTLEMPFKDCLSNPDPSRGWSPDRARQLGSSFVDPAVYVRLFLRSDDNFWIGKLPSDDAYVRPSCNYGKT